METPSLSLLRTGDVAPCIMDFALSFYLSSLLFKNFSNHASNNSAHALWLRLRVGKRNWFSVTFAPLQKMQTTVNHILPFIKESLVGLKNSVFRIYF